MKCWDQGDIDEKVILWLSFNLCHDKGWGDRENEVHYSPGLGLLGLLWLDLTREAWNQTLTYLRIPGLKLGNDSHNTRLLQ